MGKKWTRQNLAKLTLTYIEMKSSAKIVRILVCLQKSNNIEHLIFNEATTDLIMLQLLPVLYNSLQGRRNIIRLYIP